MEALVVAKTDGARYRKVYSHFWRDREVRALGEFERLIALYCFAGPQSNRIGIFTFSLALAAEDLGTGTERVRKGLGTACQRLNWHYDEAARVLYIPSWWKWNQPEAANNMTGNLKDLAEIPESPLLHMFASNFRHIDPKNLDAFRTGCQPLGVPVHNPSPTQEQEQEQEQEKEQEQDKQQEQEQEQDFATSLAASQRFDQFWSLYPERNGKKLHKQTARGKFLNFDDDDQHAAITAAANYAKSSAAADNYAKDPHRFLEAGFWRDWLTPETVRASGSDKVRKASVAIDEVMGILTGGQHGNE